MKTLEFWFDYSCPYAYLASTQVEAVARRTGAELVWCPMLLGGVFRANETPQNLASTLSPQKARHNGFDMHRWAEHWAVPLTMPATHPMRTVEALRATLATGIDPRVVHGFYRAYWIDGRAPSDPATIRDVVSAAGHDADAILAKLGDTKDDLRVRTDQAIAHGMFGAPSFVVKRDTNAVEMFWGQDRLDFVERALGGTPPVPTPRTPSRPHRVELYFDFSSPFSCLGCTQAEALAERTGAELVERPMLLGALFKSIGQADAPLTTFSAAKQAYVARDLQRWAEHWGFPLRWPSRFPMNTVKALRTYLALPEARRRAFRDATYRAFWVDDRDISNDDVLRTLVGPDADEVLARTQTKEVKDALFAATRHAVDAGVFGAPTWVVDGEHLFWGQDRVALVEAALRT